MRQRRQKKAIDVEEKQETRINDKQNKSKQKKINMYEVQINRK